MWGITPAVDDRAERRQLWPQSRSRRCRRRRRRSRRPASARAATAAAPVSALLVRPRTGCPPARRRPGSGTTFVRYRSSGSREWRAWLWATARWNSPWATGDMVRNSPRPRAGRLPGDRDPARVAAEAGDVAPHPLQRRHAVEQPVVAGGVVLGLLAQLRRGDVTEGPQAVVEGHHHDAATGQALAVEARVRARADPVAAPVDPGENRARLLGGRVGVPGRGDGAGPHVEVQTVLAHRQVEARCLGPQGLRAYRAEVVGLADLGPRHGWLGRPPAEVADRRSSVRDTAEDGDRPVSSRYALHRPCSVCTGWCTVFLQGRRRTVRQSVVRAPSSRLVSAPLAAAAEPAGRRRHGGASRRSRRQGYG